MLRPALRQLWVIFLRVGNLTFGGGDPTIAALQRELVERRGWLGPGQFALSYSLARVTPGTNLLAFCAAAAWFLGGWRGALSAVVAATVPSALLVIWLTWGYEASAANAYAAAAISGILPTVAGMMLAAVWLLAKPHMRRSSWPRTVVLLAGSALLAGSLSLPPVFVLALAAVAGYLWRDPLDS
jgi:chromate transporter